MKVFFNFKDAAKHSRTGGFFISYRNVLFPFWWNLTESREWTLFTPGRFDRAKPVPAFQRSSYATSMDQNVVSMFDPMLFMNKDISLGWYVGNRSHHYAEWLAILVERMVSQMKIEASNIVIFASSGGGIPAIRIGTKVGGINIYCSNIQVDARSYYRKTFKKMIEVAYPGMDESEVSNAFSANLTCIDWDGDFKLTYAQNLWDAFHLDNHFKPYRDEYNASKGRRDVQFIVYSDEQSGHGVLSREIELEIIKALHAGRDVTKILPAGRILQESDSF
ncbi:hypothetical protein IWX75_003199 [Arthrobacter sp. CAN_A6]|uniref:hypothetical protein n=1 Tax=Arthrobacter sp. CAN_A6 TaxID=2787721 RepID=UPI0018CB9201